MGETAYCRLEGANASSEKHNTREIVPDYVNRDLMEKNRHYYFGPKMELLPSPKMSHKERREELRKFYQENTGQKVQKSQHLLMEGLILFGEENSDDDVREAVEEFARRFEVPVIELHIHRDEGHLDDEKVWRPNLHAHFVFENLERSDKLGTKKNKKGEQVEYNLKGRTIKFTPSQLSDIQTFFAQKLNLQRGKSKSRAHLGHIQYKNAILEEKAIQKAQELQKAQDYIFNLDHQISSKIEESQKAAAKAEKLKKELDSIQETADRIVSGEDNTSLMQVIRNPSEVGKLKKAVRMSAEKVTEKESIINDLSGIIKNMTGEEVRLKAEIRKLSGEFAELKKSNSQLSSKVMTLEFFKKNFDNEVSHKLSGNPEFRSKIRSKINELDMQEEIAVEVARVMEENDLSYRRDNGTLIHYIEERFGVSDFNNADQIIQMADDIVNRGRGLRFGR